MVSFKLPGVMVTFPPALGRQEWMFGDGTSLKENESPCLYAPTTRAVLAPAEARRADSAPAPASPAAPMPMAILARNFLLDDSVLFMIGKLLSGRRSWLAAALLGFPYPGCRTGVREYWNGGFSETEDFLPWYRGTIPSDNAHAGQDGSRCMAIPAPEQGKERRRLPGGRRDHAAPAALAAADDDRLIVDLYRQYRSPLMAFVLRLTAGDRQLAEDIVQETMLRAWRQGGRLDPSAPSLMPWLATVARRIVIDEQRQKGAGPGE